MEALDHRPFNMSAVGGEVHGLAAPEIELETREVLGASQDGGDHRQQEQYDVSPHGTATGRWLC